MKTINLLLIIVLIAGISGILYYMNARNKMQQPIDSEFGGSMQETESQNTNNEEEIELAEGEELPADLAVYKDWEQVDGEGYYFMHPGYFIQDNGDHYIMAVEPRVGQEFSALVIYKPVEIDNPIQFIQLKLDEMDPSMGGDFVNEPEKVKIEGTKDAYMAAYEVKSGPTTGVNKIYLMQSPSTDKWIVVEYAENENAENIRKSIHFID